MKQPNFIEEKKLLRQGYDFIIGLDEAGRGPLAGPVVAGAVMINPNIKILNLEPWIFEVRDSKQLSARKREETFKNLTRHPCIKWETGIVSEKTIDKINILEATKLAIKKAVVSLSAQFANDKVALILDGNFKIKTNFFQEPIIKADQKVFSCAAASIIAKVTRDRIMQNYHKKYPEYGFDAHKGYGTASHFASLEVFGPCKIHRKSFYPVKIFK